MLTVEYEQDNGEVNKRRTKTRNTVPLSLSCSAVLWPLVVLSLQHHPQIFLSYSEKQIWLQFVLPQNFKQCPREQDSKDGSQLLYSKSIANLLISISCCG